MIAFIKRLFCKHKWMHIATVYGDEIIGRNYKRYACGCLKCGVMSYRRKLP